MTSAPISKKELLFTQWFTGGFVLTKTELKRFAFLNLFGTVAEEPERAKHRKSILKGLDEVESSKRLLLLDRIDPT